MVSASQPSAQRQRLLTRYVFVDTQAYEACAFDWSGRELAKLLELAKASDVRLLTTGITKAEVFARIDGRVDAALEAARKHRATYRHIGFDKVDELLSKPDVAKKAARLAFERYLIEAEVLEVPLKADLDAIVKDYFTRQPPFSDKKKSEFPDALAAASIVAWCTGKNTKVYVVSNDLDWEAYCTGHPQLCHVKSVSEVISHATVTQELHVTLLEAVRSSKALEDSLVEQLKELKGRTPRSSRYFMADRSLEASGRVRRAVVTEIQDVSVFEVNEPMFTCEVSFSADLTFDLDVTENHEDPEEGEYSNHYSREYTVGESFAAECVVKFQYDDPSNIEIESVLVFVDEIDLEPARLKHAIW